MSSKNYWPDETAAKSLITLSNAFSGVSVRIAAVAILLLVVILLPRTAGLDRLVTPDENRWLTRSANFYYALAHGDFAATYQIEHPGVLPMWAGMLAFVSDYPVYSSQAPGQFEWFHDEVGIFLRNQGYDPLALLVAGRLNMIMMIALVLIAAFWSASRLLGVWPAAMGFLLIAMDPFHTALSRLLHVDGMSGSLMLLSLLLFLNYLYRGKQKRDLLLSGAAAGLAWLTKSPALFLIPFVGLLLFLEVVEMWVRDRQFVSSNLWQAITAIVLWGSAGLAVFVLLWPAMWVDPIQTLRRILGAMISYADQGHDSLLYFNGQVYSGDPGFLFYPITFLWRTSPAVLIGLVLAVFVLAVPRLGLLPSSLRRPLGSLLLFAVLFTLFMILGAKKFDRYLLPIYPPLDLVAGVGWSTAIIWLSRQTPRQWTQVAASIVLMAALLGQAAGLILSYPYYFNYYNQLLGGITRAPEVMMIGWGEGLDQAARFLNHQPGAADRHVATGVWSTTFSYYYKGPVVSSRFEPGASVIEDWVNSDYYILYINEKQRQKISEDLTDYLATLKPIQVVRINGLDYAYVYDIRDLPPPEFLKLTPTDQGGG